MRGVIARAAHRSARERRGRAGRERAAAAGARAVPAERQAGVWLLDGMDHYERLIATELPSARVAVWIGTANLKELRVPAPPGTRARARGQGMSVLEQLQALGDAGVELRVLHGKEPSRPFATELARLPRLRKELALRQCPRVHFKVIVIDGRLLYLGSANFTGAGLGARSEGRRNFELGVLTTDEYLLDTVQSRFEAIWSGRECQHCGVRRLCARPLDRLGAKRPGVAELQGGGKTRIRSQKTGTGTVP
ncbi:MAG: phospholipase D family protein [Polyangiaceae bacterium]|nr:phospholipase D family protein [Polyangiaceae bacterium]